MRAAACAEIAHLQEIDGKLKSDRKRISNSKVEMEVPFTENLIMKCVDAAFVQFARNRGARIPLLPARCIMIYFIATDKSELSRHCNRSPYPRPHSGSSISQKTIFTRRKSYNESKVCEPLRTVVALANGAARGNSYYVYSLRNRTIIGYRGEFILGCFNFRPND